VGGVFAEQSTRRLESTFVGPEVHYATSWPLGWSGTWGSAPSSPDPRIGHPFTTTGFSFGDGLIDAAPQW